MRGPGTSHRFSGSGRAVWGAVVAGAVLLAGASVARAKPLATPACLAKKRTAWTNLRKCQGAETAKGLVGKPTDLAKCQTKLQDALTKIDLKASAAAIACRYADNGDGTVIDYDTGLQWEKKTGTDFNGSFTCRPVEIPHCVNDRSSLELAWVYVNGTFIIPHHQSPVVDGVFLNFAGHSDWRLPTITELRGIVDLSAPGCGSGSPCIDPIFGRRSPGA